MDDELRLPPGANVLRESFGDRKPPDISRKITACVACRKQKIKCHMTNSQPPCKRCKARGLSCTVNRSLQMLLEDDASWKQSVTRKIRALETYMDAVRDKLDIPLSSFVESSGFHQEISREESLVHRASTELGESIEADHEDVTANLRTWEMRMDPETGPATIPATCVGEVDANDTGFHLSEKADCISQGVVTLEQAQSLFEVYAHRLDHYLYRILGETKTLQQVRSSSPLLTSAICAVGALHSTDLGHLFARCQKAFLNHCAALLFAKSNNIDDIKGLCIGAFWLHEVSWQLNGLAVRIAIQYQYHRTIKQALHGNKTAYLQTRLYYLVYVCDHHFSLAYGRPPLTRECESINASAEFLQSEHADEDDARLVSQVQIWSIASHVLRTFGFDVETAVASEMIPKLRRFIIAFDTWRADWNERFSPHSQIGDYPRKGVGLHFHFAKLYLCSHAFRGAKMATEMPPADAPSPHDLPTELEEVAFAGVFSAKSILRTIINDTEIQAHLNGLPLYFDTMIAFAVVFLLKVATRYCTTIRVDSAEILALVRDVESVLKNSTTNMHRQHLLVVISDGVGKLLQKSQEVMQIPITFMQDEANLSLETSQHNTSNLLDQPDLMVTDFDWMNFDLLSTSNQPTMTGFDQWSMNINFNNM